MAILSVALTDFDTSGCPGALYSDPIHLLPHGVAPTFNGALLAYFRFCLLTPQYLDCHTSKVCLKACPSLPSTDKHTGRPEAAGLHGKQSEGGDEVGVQYFSVALKGRYAADNPAEVLPPGNGTVNWNKVYPSLALFNNQCKEPFVTVRTTSFTPLQYSEELIARAEGWLCKAICADCHARLPRVSPHCRQHRKLVNSCSPLLKLPQWSEAVVVNCCRPWTAAGVCWITW